jgi:hypothetical protein
MGFADARLNQQMLERTGGDLNKAIDLIVANQPAATQPTPNRQNNAEQHSLNHLRTMGFSNEEQNIKTLREKGGNLEAVINHLLKERQLAGMGRQQQQQQQQQPQAQFADFISFAAAPAPSNTNNAMDAFGGFASANVAPQQQQQQQQQQNDFFSPGNNLFAAPASQVHSGSFNSALWCISTLTHTYSRAGQEKRYYVPFQLSASPTCSY